MLQTMNRRMNLWEDSLLFLAIICVPFQDMSWQHWVAGELLKTPSSIPLFFLAISSIWRQTFSLRLYVKRDLFYLCSYCAFVSLVSIFIFGLAIGPINTLTRTAALLLEYSLFIFAVYGIDYSASRLLKSAIYCAIAITICSVLLSDYALIPWISLGNNSILHSTIPEHPDGRWRGFTQEPSFFSVLAFTIFGSLIAITKKIKRSKLATLFLIILLLGCGSKGGILSAVFAFILAGGYILGKKNKLYVIVLAATSPLALASVYVVITVLFPMSLITDSTSVPTRLTSLLWGIEETATHPFGVGIAGYIVKAEEDMGGIEAYLERVSPLKLDFEEVDTSLATYTNLSSKSMLLNGMISFGWPVVLFILIRVFRVTRALQGKHDWEVFTIWIMTICAIGCYIDSLVLYNIPIFLGIIRVWNVRGTQNQVALKRISKLDCHT